MLLQKADDMFPEGLGRPRAFIRDGTAAEKTNELLVDSVLCSDSSVSYDKQRHRIEAIYFKLK